MQSLEKRALAIVLAALLGACSHGENSSNASDTGNVTRQGAVRLDWVPPAQRVDGSPISLSEINGYRLYYGTAPDSTPRYVEIQNSAVSQYTFTLDPGVYYFRISTYDIYGQEGPLSEPIQRVL